jgi:hypothetical protein
LIGKTATFPPAKPEEPESLPRSPGKW